MMLCSSSWFNWPSPVNLAFATWLPAPMIPSSCQLIRNRHINKRSAKRCWCNDCLGPVMWPPHATPPQGSFLLSEFQCVSCACCSLQVKQRQGRWEARVVISERRQGPTTHHTYTYSTYVHTHSHTYTQFKHIQHTNSVHVYTKQTQTKHTPRRNNHLLIHKSTKKALGYQTRADHLTKHTPRSRKREMFT